MTLKYGAESDVAPTRDHIKARTNGGGKRIIACRRCNIGKASLSIVDWHLRLLASGDKRADHVARFYQRLKSGDVLRDIERMETEVAEMARDINERQTMEPRKARRAAKLS